MNEETATPEQVEFMKARVRELTIACENERIPGMVLAEHLFDLSRTVLARVGGKRVMADCCRTLAAAYDAAAAEEERRAMN